MQKVFFLAHLRYDTDKGQSNLLNQLIDFYKRAKAGDITKAKRDTIESQNVLNEY